MATFLGLKTDVDALAARTVPTVCYTLLTAELNARLRLTLMETSTTLTVNAESEALPAGFLEARSAYIDTDPRMPIEIVSEFSRNTRFRSSGQPREMSISDGVALFAPAPDGEYSVVLRYVASLAALSGDSDTNDVLDTHYDIYLYGALKHFTLAVLGGDDGGRGDRWIATYEAALDRAMKADRRKRYGAGPLVSQPHVIE